MPQSRNRLPQRGVSEQRTPADKATSGLPLPRKVRRQLPRAGWYESRSCLPPAAHFSQGIASEATPYTQTIAIANSRNMLLAQRPLTGNQGCAIVFYAINVCADSISMSAVKCETGHFS